MDIVTLSGIRKELLLYLDDGPRSLSEIRDRFDITSPEVSPRIKELIEHKLVEFECKKYHLTPIGKTIVKKYKPFIDTLNVFNQYVEFWDEHDLSSIPDELLFRIDELKNFVIIEDDTNDIDRTLIEGLKYVNDSKDISILSCVFDDSFPEILMNVAKNNIPISIIFTENIIKTIKDKHQRTYQEFLNIGNSAYVIKEPIKISHLVTDKYLYFSLCYKNGKFDLHSNLVSNDPSSIKWGIDLFEYYRERSIKIDQDGIGDKH